MYLRDGLNTIGTAAASATDKRQRKRARTRVGGAFNEYGSEGPDSPAVQKVCLSEDNPNLARRCTEIIDKRRKLKEKATDLAVCAIMSSKTESEEEAEGKIPESLRIVQAIMDVTVESRAM